MTIFIVKTYEPKSRICTHKIFEDIKEAIIYAQTKEENGYISEFYKMDNPSLLTREFWCCYEIPKIPD